MTAINFLEAAPAADVLNSPAQSFIRHDSLDSFEGELPLFPHDPRSIDAVVISDLHLGSDNCQAKAAAAFLQDVLEGKIATSRLIINGDVFDSIDFRRLKKTHWKVLSQIRHLSDKLEVIWICGNHDGSAEIISHLLGVRVVEEYILRAGRRGGEDILIIHGHQFDDFINDHPVLTWMADTAYWVLQKIDRTHYVARLAKRRSKTFVRCAAKIREGARKRARERDCRIVICGHTHHVEASGDAAVAYYNSGCWTELPSTYLTLDAGRVTVHHYEAVAV